MNSSLLGIVFLGKMFILSQFKMEISQTKGYRQNISEWKEKTVWKNVYEEECFNGKTFSNWLNVDLLKSYFSKK